MAAVVLLVLSKLLYFWVSMPYANITGNMMWTWNPEGDFVRGVFGWPYDLGLLMGICIGVILFLWFHGADIELRGIRRMKEVHFRRILAGIIVSDGGSVRDLFWGLLV